ncbi:MAG: winged helix-turn-helix domain-containing protein [Thermoplasmata archaeon]|nr:winged helix-turn-helix domain-containing protein [Thermoplasmata archaeon]
MRPQEDYLRDFAVLLTEKGVVSVSDPQQIAVYDFLCGGKKRPSDIAEALKLPSSSLHFVLDKMVDSGIIVRSKPDPAKKEVLYSNLALRIAGSSKPTPEAVAASEEVFKHPDADCKGLASVANMLEAYLMEIGLEHGQLRARYVRDLAASLKDEIGEGPIESVMQGIRDRFNRLTGYRMSVFGLNPPTFVFEGDPGMKPKMDMVIHLVRHMVENATGRTYAVKSVEDFGNEETARFKVTYDRAEPEQEPYINTSLPQMAEPEKFMIMEVDGSVAVLANEIQTQLVDAIYERPLCVTDVVSMVNMPRSTVTTNLLRMVEEGVASVFYAESGALYYGLSCSILMKRVRRVSKDTSATRDAVKAASGDGRFVEGYMVYLLASLQELGFDTDYMMVVLGAKYMRTAGQDGPKNFDSYFGKMSDIASIVGLSLSVVSVYPLTIGISRVDDVPGTAPAMTFAKGMAHQGLEMASSGIFVRVSEETPDDMKVSFKEIYPSLSMNPAASAAAEAEALADPAPAKRRTSSVRDALRNRSAKTDGRPMRTVRYITGIAMVALAAFAIILAAGGTGFDNTADADSYMLSADDGIVLYTVDGTEISSSYELKAGEVLSVSVESAGSVGIVIDGVAYPISEVYQESEGYYAISISQNTVLTEIQLLDSSFEGLEVGIYDFGKTVTDEYAYNFQGYYGTSDYEELAGGLWVTADAMVVLTASEGEYIALPDVANVYLQTVVMPAIGGADASAAVLPSAYATVDLGNAAFEIDGYYVAGSVKVAKYHVIEMDFVSTDGPVVFTIDQDGRSSYTIDMKKSTNRTLSLSVYQDVALSYAHIVVQ